YSFWVRFPSPAPNLLKANQLLDQLQPEFYHVRWCGPAKLTAVATEAEAQRRTNFSHSERTELCNSPSQAILSDGHDIVQTYGTVRFHAVVLGEENLGRYTANSGRDRRHCNSG